MNLAHFQQYVYTYRGIHEKASGDVVTAIFYTTLNIYLSFFTQIAVTTSPEPFSWISLYLLLEIS